MRELKTGLNAEKLAKLFPNSSPNFTVVWSISVFHLCWHIYNLLSEGPWIITLVSWAVYLWTISLFYWLFENWFVCGRFDLSWTGQKLVACRFIIRFLVNCCGGFFTELLIKWCYSCRHFFILSRSSLKKIVLWLISLNFVYDNVQFSNWTHQSCVTYKIHTFRSFCLRNLDSAIQLLMGFRIPWPVFQISNPRIHDSTSNNCPNSAFHEQTFPWLWN